MFTAEPRAIFEELRRASAGGVADYAGVTWERIAAEDGVFWPCPARAIPARRGRSSTVSLHRDGRARFHRGRAPRRRPRRRMPHYPLILTTGRVMAQYQSGTQTRRVPALDAAEPEAFCEIHPDIAAALGIADGRHGAADHAARHGGDARAAEPDDPARYRLRAVPLGRRGLRQPADQHLLDPVSRIPEFKVCAVAASSGGQRGTRRRGHGEFR